jgi:hypothetical protein
MNPVYRRFSIATRKEIFSGQINGAPSQDSVTLGYYRFAYDNVSFGAYTDVRPGMTIDIGTTPGARDVGYTRVRKAPTSSFMYIAEVASGRLPMADNLYFTVREEYLPWRILPRGVGASVDGATYTNDLTLYMDYDNAYTDQNDYMPPKANITRSASSYLAPKPAGTLDSGQTYRTIVLSSAQSFAIGTTIASRLWEVEDCTIVTGASDSTTITVRVPEGFRYIHLTVTDANGKSSTMHFPLWAHGEIYAPIVNFKVTSDETNETGRHMNFEFFGADDLVSEAVLPRMSLICYWEEPDDDRPEDYRDQYLGWAKREATVLRLYRTRYLLETTGIAGWLESYSGSSLYIYDPLETPDRWYEMRNITIDKCAYFILMYFCNAVTLCNLYLSGNTHPTKGEMIEVGTVWRQVIDMIAGYYGVAGADSLNGIWLRKHFCYLTDGERNAIESYGTITRTDLTDEIPVTYKSEFTKKVGWVIGGGSSFNGVDNTLYASAAPGLTPDDAVGEEQAPGQRLPVSGAQTELNRLTGHRYAFQNNPNTDIVFELMDNDDIYEPAFMRPFTYQEDMSNVAGTSVDKRFLIRSVSITHSNRVGEKAKRIVLTAYVETSGNPADTKPVPVYDTENPPVLIRPTPIESTAPDTSALLPYTEDTLPTRMYIAAVSSSQAAIATEITTGGTFIWTEISTGLGGTSIWSSSDPFDYNVMYQLTTTGLYRCTPYAFSGWTLVADNAAIFGNATYVGSKIIMSINRRGWIYIISGSSMSAWSSDYGATWANNGGSASTSGISLYNHDVVVSPFNDGASAVGWMYKCYQTSSGTNTIYKSTDWGQTWSVLTTITSNAHHTGRLNIPYKRGLTGGYADNINDSSQWVYFTTGWGNQGNVNLSKNGGTSFTSVVSYNSAGTNTPATTTGGSSIQTFTYDGDKVFIASAKPINQAGLFILNESTVVYSAVHFGVGSAVNVMVNGFSYGSGSALFWNNAGTAKLFYTFDDGANVYEANLPTFFTGSKLLAYAEWPLIDFMVG